MFQEVQHNPELLRMIVMELIPNKVSEDSILDCRETQFLQWLQNDIPKLQQPDPAPGKLNTSSVLATPNSTPPAILRSSNLVFLRSNEDFLKLRTAYRTRPDMLKLLSRKFIAENQHLKSIVMSNEVEFLRLINESSPTVMDKTNSIQTATQNFSSPAISRLTKLAFLRCNEEFLKLRTAYQAKPTTLRWLRLTQKFFTEQPHLKSIIMSNEADFVLLMNEGLSNETDAAKLGGSSSDPALAE